MVAAYVPNVAGTLADMKILGISTEHDSGVALAADGRLIYAANEERFDRMKFSMALPVGALESVSKALPGFERNVDAVAVGSTMHTPLALHERSKELFLVRLLNELLAILRADRLLFGTHVGVAFVTGFMRLLQWPYRLGLKRFLAARGFRSRITYVDHHRAHAASAYSTGPWNKALVVTLDAQGDGMCSRVFMGEAGRLKELHAIPFYHSPGHYYAYVTLMFGFKEGREGKVTGLAARGDWSKTVEVFRDRISFDTQRLVFVNNGFYRIKELHFLKKKLAGFGREDIAAGVQKHLEDLVTAYISGLIERYAGGGPIPVVLAGGVFANVKLNQRIIELPLVSGAYIFPHMGDGGLAGGAALWDAMHDKPLQPSALHDAYLGPSSTDEEIEAAFVRAGVVFRRSQDAAKDVAGLLANGKVVAVFRGKMEYGPRALGNRSILYQATDPTVNDWLNTYLKRSEFMPFAPILKKQHVADYFNGWEKCEKALEFMTITLQATDRCKKEAPAIVHVDGTARPQLVLPDVNPFIDSVLGEYEKRTGLRVLINTSFNMHEEPIVCSPDDAVRAFVQGRLDVLSAGPYIAERASS